MDIHLETEREATSWSIKDDFSFPGRRSEDSDRSPSAIQLAGPPPRRLRSERTESPASERLPGGCRGGESLRRDSRSERSASERLYGRMCGRMSVDMSGTRLFEAGWGDTEYDGEWRELN
jgi:hypothetical protein